jgi:hypothetical protein
MCGIVRVKKNVRIRQETNVYGFARFEGVRTLFKGVRKIHFTKHFHHKSIPISLTGYTSEKFEKKINFEISTCITSNLKSSLTVRI